MPCFCPLEISAYSFGAKNTASHQISRNILSLRINSRYAVFLPTRNICVERDSCIMITIFNRKEILITRDLKMLNKCTDELSSKGIAYKVVTNSIGNPDRNHGIPGVKAESAYEYRVYVNKKDA